MESLTDVAKILLYCHVDVSTQINRSCDYRSTFCSPAQTPSSKQDSKKLVYTGYLKAFDPITKSVILCNIENELVSENILILGRHITTITKSDNSVVNLSPNQVQEVINSGVSLKLVRHPYLGLSKSYSDEAELSKRCEEIMEWLKKNRIPVERRDNDLIVAEVVKIKPPYEHATDYICPTRTILERLKRIIESRPNK